MARENLFAPRPDLVRFSLIPTSVPINRRQPQLQERNQAPPPTSGGLEFRAAESFKFYSRSGAYPERPAAHANERRPGVSHRGIVQATNGLRRSLIRTIVGNANVKNRIRRLRQRAEAWSFAPWNRRSSIRVQARTRSARRRPAAPGGALNQAFIVSRT